jgi:betaine-aldehyde dehydrogenase
VSAPRALRNFINGEFCRGPWGANDRTSSTRPPASDRRLLARERRPEDINSMRMPPPPRPLHEWGPTTPSERQQALLKIADAIEARADEFVTPGG